MAIPKTEVLITVDGAERGRYLCEPGEYVLGRNADCQLVVEADLVSRRHAKLTINFDHAFIEDLGSSNGTQVNGQTVAGNTRLWPNQKIQIGAATIELRRIKVESTPDMTVTPTGEVMRRVLPEAFLREKKYDIGGVIAQGGMGAILNAREATTERTVAMKVMLNTNSPDDLLRFLTEAKITAQLEHPNVVPVHELSVDENGQVFYTMKMVKGITLRKVLDLLADGVGATVKKYPLAALVTVFQKVCDALAFAHSKGVIHRDLKPENIMIGDYGEVLLMDWGLAKRMGNAEGGVRSEGGAVSSLHTPHSELRTLSGTVMGTPQFMSPEQARGEVETLDARSDIYALGGILYQILSLRIAVAGKDAMEVVGKVGRGEIEPLSNPQSAIRNPQSKIPDSLAAVVRKAMAFDREARYRSVPDLQKDIEAFQNGFATGAENAGLVKQVRLLVLRHKALFTTAFAAWAIITALAVWFVMNVTHERKVAIGERNRAETALTNLAKTAPTFFALSKGLVEQGKFDDALEKLGFAISLDIRNPDYLLQRANLLQATQKIAEAAEVYRDLVASRVGPAAKLNLDLCEKLLRDNAGSSELKRESQGELVDAMIKQGRAVEAAPLSVIVGKGSDTALAAIRARLKPLLAMTGPGAGVAPLPNGTFLLNFSSKPVVELPPLHGLPITEVDLGGTKVSDLTPLKGLRLRRLNLNRTPVTDLSPLAGMPLESLRADDTTISDLAPLKGMPLTELILGDSSGKGRSAVSDLSPLRGMALKKLIVANTSVADLRPLAGMPIEELNITQTAVNDLSPLAGMPLTSFHAISTKITDLSPLRGMPLRVLFINYTPVSDLSALAGMPIEELHLSGTKVTDIAVLRTLPLKRLTIQRCPIKDLSPLADCKALERLNITKVTTDISFLRALPKLQRLTDEDDRADSLNGTPAAEQFWQKYDAQRAAPK